MHTMSKLQHTSTPRLRVGVPRVQVQQRLKTVTQRRNGTKLRAGDAVADLLEVAGGEAAPSPAAIDAGSLALPAIEVPDLSGATDAVGEAAAALASGAGEALGDITSGASQALESITTGALGGLSGVTSSTSAALQGLSSGVEGITGGVTASASKALSSVTDLTGGVTAGAGQAISGVAQGVQALKEEFDREVGSAGSAISGLVSGVSASLDQATSGVRSSVSQVTGTFSKEIDLVTSSVSNTVSGVQTSVATSWSSATSQLPPEVQSALTDVGDAFGEAAATAAQYPLQIGGVLLAAAVPLYLKSYSEKFTGYAGDINPEQVLDMLNNDDAVLIDIRTQEQREARGMPELKLGARFKAAIWEVDLALDPAFARRCVDPSRLALEINAAYIAGLGEVKGPATKLVVMDDRGDELARDLAKALKAVGVGLPFVMYGGFKQWQEDGLGVVEGTTEYNNSISGFLSDELEVIAQKLEVFKNPLLTLPLLLGTGGVGWAVYNYHTTLEFIGFLGIFATIASKALQYDSPAAALEDLTSTVNNISAKLQPKAKPAAKARLSSAGSGGESSWNPAAAAAGAASSTAAAAAAIEVASSAATISNAAIESEVEVPSESN